MSDSPPCVTDADPVGLAEIAHRAGVQRKTAVQWRHRRLLPAPRWPSVSGAPAWDWNLDIIPFLTRTGRIRPHHDASR
jgi:hypothetical protein